MRALKIAGVVIALLALAVGVAHAWVDASLRRLGREAAAAEAALARPREGRPPRLFRGPPRVGVNGADEYLAILNPLEDEDLPSAPDAASLAFDARRWFYELDEQPVLVPPRAAAYVALHAPSVASVTAALDAERCDWAGATALALPMARETSAITVATLLLLDGHARALAGDAAGAADRCLDAVRFAVDVGDGTVARALVARGIIRRASREMERVLASRALPPVALARLAEQVAILEGAAADPARTLAHERAWGLRRLLDVATGTTGLDADEPLAWLPARLRVALFWRGYDGRMRALEATTALPPAERKARIAAIGVEASESRSPFAGAFGNLAEYTPALDDARAQLAALRAALEALEEAPR